MYKNIEKQKVLHMAEQVDYQDGRSSAAHWCRTASSA